MLVTTKRRVVEEEVTRFINVEEHEKRMREKMKYEENRLHSFPSFKIAKQWLNSAVKRRLAKAGFFFYGSDSTECSSCGLRKPLSFWRWAHDPETVHRTESPNCDFFKGDNVPIDGNNPLFIRKTVSAPHKRQDSKLASGSVMMREQNHQRKENNTKVKLQTKTNTYSENQSPNGTKEGNTERKNNAFSPRLQPSSVQTVEPDKIQATCKQQRSSSVPAESTTNRINPEGSAKVSVSLFVLNIFLIFG